MRRAEIGTLIGVLLVAATVTAEDGPSLNLGFRVQGWYQAVEGGAADGGAMNDFMVRRAYLSLSAKVTPELSLFAHLAGDRLGQDGLDVPSVGLGSGVALRDGWVAWAPDPRFRVQLGRMYVPFTRAFGTESTFTLLTMDLPYAQGGVRGSLFYASKVGRDDGLVLWGTPLGGRLQYRVGLAEGVEGAANPADSLRYSGRLAVNLLEPESAWFNRGTYLGEKKVLAFGLGVDRQDELALPSGVRYDSRSWTADGFLDHPVGDGAITVEASYVEVEGMTQPLPFAGLQAGADARISYLQAGYLFPGDLGPGRVQVYGRAERTDPRGGDHTASSSVGANYLMRGHDAKLTLDWSRLDRTGTSEHTDIMTVQIQLGL
jgi:hypothetical protein